MANILRQFPSSIRVGSNDYKVDVVSGLSSADALWGRIAYADTSIKVEESLSPSMARDVLVHEMTHAIIYEAGYEDHEEEQANRIGKILSALLRDNDMTFLREDD